MNKFNQSEKDECIWSFLKWSDPKETKERISVAMGPGRINLGIES